MLIYLADLAHTYSTKNESLMVPLNIGFIKAYAKKQHGNNIDIKLFKNPDELLKTFYKKVSLLKHLIFDNSSSTFRKLYKKIVLGVVFLLTL